MPSADEPEDGADSESASLLYRAHRGAIGFIRGFSFGRHLDWRYD